MRKVLYGVGRFQTNIYTSILNQYWLGMADNDYTLNNVKFDSDAIPKDISNDFLENVDDMSMSQQRKNRFSQDTLYRKYLANWVMFIVPVWLIFVITILVLCGGNVLVLKDEVLIALLATTTINVLGLAYIVLKGIFPEEQHIGNDDHT